MDRQPIRFQWSQQEGPRVRLSSDSSVKPTFVAPTVTEPTILKFHLTVKDPLGLADSAVVRVKILPAGTVTTRAVGKQAFRSAEQRRR